MSEVDFAAGVNDAATARRNGWGVGTRLAGDEGFGETVIEITAVGEELILAKTISRRGDTRLRSGEATWTFVCRDWKVVLS